MSMTRAEVIAAVRMGKVVVWFTEEATFLQEPGPNEKQVAVMLGPPEEMRAVIRWGWEQARKEYPGVMPPLVCVEGVMGIAATDPEWDGRLQV
jgi:hypothetical protein